MQASQGNVGVPAFGVKGWNGSLIAIVCGFVLMARRLRGRSVEGVRGAIAALLGDRL